MKLFNKVAIVGVGLIGGSLGLAIKKRKLADKVIGVSRQRKTLRAAIRSKAIDIASQDIGIVKDADLIILAAPVGAILTLAPKIAKIAKKNCIITDVGSTKKEIVSSLEKVFSNYAGSHPLAGSEKRGVVNACADLFNNSLCILTPTRATRPVVLNKIKSLWQAIGARIAILAPDKHDKVLSFISHLPHIAAFSLIDTIDRQDLKFASGGLKDTTRIACSDAKLWADIFLSNRKNILKSINEFQQKLSGIKSAVTRKDKKLLLRILQQAKNKRELLG
jgi:prephenate dehydrogenase